MRLPPICLLTLLFLLPISSLCRAQPLDLAQYRGKVVYLDFWASWCAPCKLSFPWMNEVQRLYGSDGVVIVGVNVDHDRAAAQEFLQDSPAQFPILFDPKGQIAGKYPIKGMPASFVIGKDGRVRYAHEGFETRRKDEYLSHLLAAAKE